MRKVIQTTNDLGGFIKEARERAQMTLEAVASRSGYTTQTLSNLEKHRGSVNLNTLLSVATSFCVKVELNFEDKHKPIIK